jgi:hypothetical protein
MMRPPRPGHNRAYRLGTLSLTEADVDPILRERRTPRGRFHQVAGVLLVSLAANMIGVASAPLASASAVTTGILAFALPRRRRRGARHRLGIRRHDGSGRVWEYEYETDDDRDFLFAREQPTVDRVGTADVLENPTPRHRLPATA